ncbi:SDR family oxidoreductase [Paucibacter soli]|uniref:SDR family oxidoreductase n=1 Tax=Paucibacter soli TaxID=3133433 RepID=UPI0030B72011
MRALWHGQVAVVTGAAGGLGAALARRLAAAGARVALLDRDGAAAEKLAVELRGSGCQALAWGCDISDAAQVQQVFAQLEGQWGAVTLLINNAGIAARALARDCRAEVVRRVMAVNYFGAVHCTAAALPSLLAARGRIVVISSVAGFAPLIGRSAYAASKHALHGYFDSLRSELHEAGVAVTLVCPSFIATGIEAAALGGDGRPLARRRDVSGRLATPDEVAAQILRAAARRQRLLLPSATARAAYLLSRLAPALYETLMRRRVGAEFAEDQR